MVQVGPKLTPSRAHVGSKRLVWRYHFRNSCCIEEWLIQQVVALANWGIWFESEFKNLRLHGSLWIFRSNRTMQKITAKQIQILVPRRCLNCIPSSHELPPRDIYQSYFPHRKLSVQDIWCFRNKFPDRPWILDLAHKDIPQDTLRNKTFTMGDGQRSRTARDPHSTKRGDLRYSVVAGIKMHQRKRKPLASIPGSPVDPAQGEVLLKPAPKQWC